LPLPPAIAAHYALPGAVTQVDLEPVRPGAKAFHGHLRCGEEIAEFTLQCPAADRAPLVLLVPILAGGDTLMEIFASRLTGQGFAVAWCRRAAPALRPPQRGADLELLFRRTVVHQRMLLHWAQANALVDGRAPMVFGVSLGGMVATVLAAVEPMICGTAVCAAGGDLPDLLLHSAEGRVREWVAWRAREDGLGPLMLEEELRRLLESDPARLAPFVATASVLMVEPTLDQVIPLRNRTMLWEALGRPQRLQVPFGHYSAALAIGPILQAAGDFFRHRLATAAVAAPPPP
jgi:dienelactone hydrolase